MLKNFNTNLIKKNDKILLAVSGGIDSMVMLDNFYRLSKTKNLTLMVAHVDHQKRKTSYIDNAFVKDVCQKLGIPFFTKALTYKDNENFHDYARTLRYEFFYNVAKENNINKLALAHNKNDNAETVLMRLTRGSSLEGYRGILDVSKFKDLTIIRPLLNISRKEIIEYKEKNDILFREDESNFEDDYTRNRFRHHILPLLESENPKYLDKFTQFSQYISYAYELVEENAKSYLKAHVKREKNKHILDCKSLLELEKILQIEIIKRVINIHTNDEIELSFQNINDIIDLMKSKKPHLEIKLDSNLYIYKSYNNLYIQTNKNVTQPYEYKINSLTEINLNDNENIYITKNHSKYSGNIYKLCYNNLDQIFPLTIRNRRDGDKIKITSGTKKIKDLFIDKKVPKTERDTLPIILNKNDEIIWIPKYYSKKYTGENAIYLIYQKR